MDERLCALGCTHQAQDLQSGSGGGDRNNEAVSPFSNRTVNAGVDFDID